MNAFLSLVNYLDDRLKQPLPGQTAHQLMEARSAGYLGSKPGSHTLKSAVLILLYPCADEIRFPLILRNSYEGFHSAEIGFPGGRFEPRDEHLTQTALREAREEIGLNPDDVTVLGTLTEIYIGPSDFLVLPVVAYSVKRPEFLADPREVQQIMEADLSYFSNPGAVSCGPIKIPGDEVLTPYYKVAGNKVWGATAKMINELQVLLDEK